MHFMENNVGKRTASKQVTDMHGPCIWMICRKPWRPLKYKQEKNKTVEDGLKVLKQFTEKLAAKKRNKTNKKQSKDIQSSLEKSTG